MIDTYIVIPAWNEEKTISKVIQDLKDNNFNNIVVVDDGSKDNTTKIAKEQGVTVLNHIINRGQGAAIQTGTEHALKQGAEIIIHFDADGQFKAEEIQKMIKPVAEEDYDIALGSRFLGQTINIPPLKKLTLKGGIIFTRIFSNIKLTDTHNGFRALTKKAAKEIEITQDEFAHASEILDLIKKKNLKYKEIPVTVVYSDYAKTKGQSILNSVRIIKDLIIRKITK